ncbi:MAG TPA: amidase [Gaiellaceae bacterium]|jgi:amidase
MTLQRPSASTLRAVAERQGLDPSPEELEFLRSLGDELLGACERLDALEGERLPVEYPRRGGVRRPEPAENPHNAWAWRCGVEGEAEGALAGLTVALKDIIPVAGVPMSAGSVLLRGHVPDFDATVVTRILRAGGTIVGVATTEDMCLSGASLSSSTGFVRNPHDPARSAGGSSSGVAALLAAGDADVGIGADQGGSIRIPASLCGVLGLKPTYGLIPYTGCIPIDPSVDYLGPLGRRVEDVAALLEAVAGFDDGLDPRQRADLEPRPYRELLGDGRLEGLRVGVVGEGFGRAGLSDERVDATVREAALGLAGLGAAVEDVSVPEHLYAMDVHASILLQGGSEFMVRGNGVGLAGKGFHDAALAEAMARGRRLQADELFASVKYAMVMGGYLWERYGGAYYAKAQNLALRLRRAYDAALASFDVLALPTTCVVAPPLPGPDATPFEAVQLALDPALISNTCAFNHSGHPALSVPVGPVDGLPAGLMLVGRRGDDAALLRVARAMELAGGLL